MNHDWEQIGYTVQALAERCRELGGAPDPAWAGLAARDFVTAMRVAEARERLCCDALLRAFVQPDGGLGKLTPRQAYFCAMRCLCALDTLGILHAELTDRPLYPQPPADWTNEQLLEWLLVSNWQQRHDTWLKLAATSISMGLGLCSG